MSENKGATSGAVVQMGDTLASKGYTSPWAACKNNKNQCSEKSMLVPCFPPDDPQKFLLVKWIPVGKQSMRKWTLRQIATGLL